MKAESRSETNVIRWGLSDSRFGRVFIAANPSGITHLSFPDEDVVDPHDILGGNDPITRSERDDAFASEMTRRIFSSGERGDLRLAPQGTAFQERVWRALMEIPEGSTTTYGALAAKLGMPGGSRAVGGAVGANPIAWLIPCHRVIRSDGGLGGYRWGVQRKRRMLAEELAITPR